MPPTSAPRRAVSPIVWYAGGAAGLALCALVTRSPTTDQGVLTPLGFAGVFAFLYLLLKRHQQDSAWLARRSDTTLLLLAFGSAFTYLLALPGIYMMLGVVLALGLYETAGRLARGQSLGAGRLKVRIPPMRLRAFIVRHGGKVALLLFALVFFAQWRSGWTFAPSGGTLLLIFVFVGWIACWSAFHLRLKAEETRKHSWLHQGAFFFLAVVFLGIGYVGQPSSQPGPLAPPEFSWGLLAAVLFPLVTFAGAAIFSRTSTARRFVAWAGVESLFVLAFMFVATKGHLSSVSDPVPIPAILQALGGFRFVSAFAGFVIITIYVIFAKAPHGQRQAPFTKGKDMAT